VEDVEDQVVGAMGLYQEIFELEDVEGLIGDFGFHGDIARMTSSFRCYIALHIDD
jgi:hypothetical protein